MREIRFRFYSKHLGKFVAPDDSIFVGALKDPSMNPMQYTGLKDKNGVDVYEGDIVKAYYPGIDPIYITGEVRYDEEQFLGYAISGTRMSACTDFKVIGNIYENEELLK